MFCPNCGANNLTEQKYCRLCGLNLEKSAESLLEQIPSAKSTDLMRREKNIERFGNFALSGLGIIGIIGLGVLLWTLINKFLLTGVNPLFAVLIIAFFIFALLSLAFVVFNESLKEKKAKINPALPNELPGSKDTGKLLEEKSFEPVPSVTENSTELLFVENKTRKIK